MMIKAWLMVLGALWFILPNAEAQKRQFQFPTQVHQDRNRTYTLEALEALEKREQGDKSIRAYSDEETEQRIKDISDQIPMKFNKLISSYIKAYVGRRKNSTEQIISRSMVYFPIFEEAFQRYNMPTDLKYLAIVESALNPKAVSPVGATGPWQFMKGTAKQYKLKINGTIDERKDPNVASDAAARFLKDLYERYGDWHLAIAAYNCGPGRVNKALRKTSDKTYWGAAKFLPKETRNYVPAFIAVAYAMNYYHLHNIYPEHPEYDLQVTDRVRVYEKVSLHDVAKATNLTLEAVQFLNPSWLKGMIPTNTHGYVLTLPLTKMGDFQNVYTKISPVQFQAAPILTSYESRITHNASPSTSYSATNLETTVSYEQTQTIYRVKRGDNLGKLSKKFNCSVRDLRSWNNLKGSMLRVGQRLTIMELKAVIKKAIASPKQIEQQYTNTTTVTRTPLTTTPRATIASPAAVATPAYAQIQTTSNMTSGILQSSYRFESYKVKRGDSLWNIANKFNIKIGDIIQINGLSKNQKLHPGKQLQIPVKR